MMDLTETRISRKIRYEGPLFTIYSDTVRLPDGSESGREVVEHVDGVAVLPLDEDDNVIMVRQYRYVLGRTLLEIPAGKLDPGETPAEGGLRELSEETGIEPKDLIPLGKILPAPGCYSETLYLYLARDLKMGKQHLDSGEFLNVERIPFSDMLLRCLNGEIEDAKTVTAILKAKLLFDL